MRRLATRRAGVATVGGLALIGGLAALLLAGPLAPGPGDPRPAEGRVVDPGPVVDHCPVECRPDTPAGE